MNDEPKCWWCGDIADTREHRVKASQLWKMLASGERAQLSDQQILNAANPINRNKRPSRLVRI